MEWGGDGRNPTPKNIGALMRAAKSYCQQKPNGTEVYRTPPPPPPKTISKVQQLRTPGAR
jgi:hypothetical protein